MKGFVTALLVLMIAFGVQAAPQLQDFTVTPTTLKPGTSGTITVTIYNPSTSEYLSGAEIQGTASQLQFSGGVSLGDIGTLGTSIASMSFKVRDYAKPGNYVITLTIAYVSNLGGTATGYKKFSIPVSVSTTNSLQVEEVVVSKSAIAPRDSFTITATLLNEGGDLRNIILSYPALSNFTFDGRSKIQMGDLKGGNSKRISIPMIAGPVIKAGYYSIPLTITYDDAVATGTTEELLVGPITATSDAQRITVFAETESVSPGSSTDLVIAVRNTADEPLSEVHVVLPEESEFFVPLDFNEKVISIIEPNEVQRVKFHISVNTNAVLKAYGIPITVKYQGRTIGSEEIEKTVGVRVAGTPELSVITSTSPAPMSSDNTQYTLSVQISNIGDTAVRAVSVYASSNELEFIGITSDYLGTLNLDDYSTSQFPVLVKKGITPGSYLVNIRLTFKDAYNNAYDKTKVATIEIVSPEIAQMARGVSGSNPLNYAIIIIVLAVIGYFAYKKWFKKKKPHGV
ncbi:hypothetical protein KJ765_02395 [Candidatus Micrarchaeota archaeon]|nr:hypothetical protein [Candidatus Micrarchaeota archaeon]